MLRLGLGLGLLKGDTGSAGPGGPAESSGGGFTGRVGDSWASGGIGPKKLGTRERTTSHGKP